MERKSQKLKIKLKIRWRLLGEWREVIKIPQLLNKSFKKMGQDKNKNGGRSPQFGVYKKNDFKIFRNVMEQNKK